MPSPFGSPVSASFNPFSPFFSPPPVALATTSLSRLFPPFFKSRCPITSIFPLWHLSSPFPPPGKRSPCTKFSFFFPLFPPRNIYRKLLDPPFSSPRASRTPRDVKHKIAVGDLLSSLFSCEIEASRLLLFFRHEDECDLFSRLKGVLVLSFPF